MQLKDRKIIITGGPTREWIDPVRFISNPSTGKMGIALADEAVKRAKEVVFIHGNVSEALLREKSYKLVAVENTQDMLNAVLSELTPDTVLIMAAAPADYTPIEKHEKKIKKESGSDVITLSLKKNPDILLNVAEQRKSKPGLSGIFVVGFAAETNDTESNALDKLHRKNLDMICLNDVKAANAGFGVDTNIITIFTKQNEKIEIPLQSKKDAAAEILNQIEKKI